MGEAVGRSPVLVRVRVLVTLRPQGRSVDFLGVDFLGVDFLGVDFLGVDFLGVDFLRSTHSAPSAG